MAKTVYIVPATKVVAVWWEAPHWHVEIAEGAFFKTPTLVGFADELHLIDAEWISLREMPDWIKLL